MLDGTVRESRQRTNAPLVLVPRNTITFRTVVLTFDGSFQGDKGAGVGVTLGYDNLDPFLKVACPTVSFESQ